MWLRRVISRVVRRAQPVCRASVIGAALATLALSGCTNSEPIVTGSTPPPGAPTIAFESIDGPPRPVFDRLVAALSAEAETRNLPVVSRTGVAAYRVRAYLATHVEKKQRQAILTWVWDVFDARESRAFRLTGEHPLGPPRADVWAQCDDAVLLRVAASGFDALAARLGAPVPAAPAPTREPAADGPEVAAMDTWPTAAFAEPRH